METKEKRNQLWMMWTLIILMSSLPNILWQELIHQSAEWMIYVKLSILVIIFLIGYFIKQFSSWKRLVIVVFSILLFEYFAYRISLMPYWNSIFKFLNSSTLTGLATIQVIRVVFALVIIGILFLIGYCRQDFFFVKGDTSAAASQVKIFGIDEGTSWKKLGKWLAFLISLGTLAFLLTAGLPTKESLLKALLPYFPLVLVFSVTNAFGEELIYRAAWLAPLYPIVGKTQSMWMMAFYFGVAHFYGVPYGIVGVIMSGFLGWILTKAMLETKGFFWPWFIHFCQDVMIFSFIILGSVNPGG